MEANANGITISEAVIKLKLSYCVANHLACDSAPIGMATNVKTVQVKANFFVEDQASCSSGLFFFILS